MRFPHDFATAREGENGEASCLRTTAFAPQTSVPKTGSGGRSGTQGVKKTGQFFTANPLQHKHLLLSKNKCPFDREAREQARRVRETKRRVVPRHMILPPTGASIFSIGPEKASTFREKPTVIFIKLWGFRSKLSTFQSPLPAFIFDPLHLFKKAAREAADHLTTARKL